MWTQEVLQLTSLQKLWDWLIWEWVGGHFPSGLETHKNTNQGSIFLSPNLQGHRFSPSSSSLLFFSLTTNKTSSSGLWLAALPDLLSPLSLSFCSFSFFWLKVGQSAAWSCRAHSDWHPHIHMHRLATVHPPCSLLTLHPCSLCPTCPWRLCDIWHLFVLSLFSPCEDAEG